MVEILDQTRNKYLKSYYKDIKMYYKKVLDTLKIKDDKEVSLIICGNKKIHSINKTYRHIDRPTDVISFAEIDATDLYGDHSYLGDIFINVDRVKSQSAEYGHSEKREFCFLFVHGMLHLLGYDHMKPEDEKVMFALQEKIIGNLK